MRESERMCVERTWEQDRSEAIRGCLHGAQARLLGADLEHVRVHHACACRVSHMWASNRSRSNNVACACMCVRGSCARRRVLHLSSPCIRAVVLHTSTAATCCCQFVSPVLAGVVATTTQDEQGEGSNRSIPTYEQNPTEARQAGIKGVDWNDHQCTV